MTNNKALFMKWIQYLLYVNCVLLVTEAVSFLGDWVGWVNIILSFGTLFVIYKLAPVNKRYGKAAIFLAIAFVITLIFRFTTVGVLILVGSICSWIALYQEYSAHSEMLDGVDDKLARKWHSLFNWQIWGGFGLAFLESILVIALAAASTQDADSIATILLALVEGYDIIIKVFYLIYLKRMLTAYENYEPSNETFVETQDK